jgi:hypothetical protein
MFLVRIAARVAGLGVLTRRFVLVLLVLVLESGHAE